MNKLLLVVVGLLCAVALLAVTHFRKTGSDFKPAAPTAVGQAAREGEAITVSTAPAAHAPAAPSVRTPASNWQTQFIGSSDYLQFVKAALPAAKTGDGRAAWYIGRALQQCVLEIKQQREGVDLEAHLQQELASLHPSVEQWMRDKREQDARRCFALAKENPFGDLPETSAYWDAQAYVAGDPLAQEDVAAKAAADIMVDPRMSDDARASKVKIVQDNLRAAVESGDPDALYRAGKLLANPELSSDTMRGFAVALAACDLGRDCSAANPDMIYYEWAARGLIPPGWDEAAMLQQSLGQEAYAQLYARSQQVVTAARAHDWNAVLASLTIDKHP